MRLLSELNIDKNILADVYESVVISGHVTEETAEITDLA